MAAIISELENDKRHKQATFNEACDEYFSFTTKKTSNKDLEYYHKLKSYIGNMYLNDLGTRPKQSRRDMVHVLNKYVMDRCESNKLSITTLNKELAFVNMIGKRAVSEYGLIDYFTPIRQLDKDEGYFYGLNPPKKKSHLDYDLQILLLNELPEYLRDMALFSINTGQRDAVVCNLRWKFLCHDDPYAPMDFNYGGNEISYFKVPKELMKSEEHMTEEFAYIVLNDTAKDLVERQKYKRYGLDDFVFQVDPRPMSSELTKVRTMNNYEYQSARERVAEIHPEIMNTDVHSFKRTFVTRLIDKGVPYDWVQRMANHKLPEVTERYNQMNPEKRRTMYDYLQRLIEKPKLKEVKYGT